MAMAMEATKLLILSFHGHAELTHFMEWWDLISNVACTETQVATPYDNLQYTGSSNQSQIHEYVPPTKFSEKTHDVVPKFNTL